MAIKFTSQTITCNNETIFIGKIVYVKKSSKSYKKDSKPIYNAEQLAKPKKFALLIFTLYVIHFFVKLNFYFIGDLLCFIAIIQCLFWDRNLRMKNKASIKTEVKKAFFLYVKWETGEINLGSDNEGQITELFKYLSDLYYGEVKAPFEGDAINNYISLDGPTVFSKDFEEFTPSGGGGGGNPPDKNLYQVFNESLDNLIDRLAIGVDNLGNNIKNFSLKESLSRIKLPKRRKK